MYILANDYRELVQEVLFRKKTVRIKTEKRAIKCDQEIVIVEFLYVIPSLEPK